MITLEEAIEHCEEKSCGKNECAAEHRQLAKWLKELRYYRSIWKDNSEYPTETDCNNYPIPIVACCSKYKDVICGYHLVHNEGSEHETHSIGDYGWSIVKKWAYLKDVFPYRCYYSDLNFPVIFDETRKESYGSNNRELESHKAWETSLLFADRIRGCY